MWNEVLDDLIVVKRSGQRVEFNASKIAIAIKKAYESTFNEVDEKKIYKTFEKVLAFINNNYKERKTISVEDIQDVIENILKEEHEDDVYNSFKEYRQRRAASRKVFTEKQQHKFVRAIERVQEQSNSDTKLTPYEMINKFGKIISSEYSKSYILDNKYVRAFEEGNIYIHNLDYFSLGIFSHFNYRFNDRDYLDDLLYEIKNAELEINSIISLGVLDYKLIPYIIKKYKNIIKNMLEKYLHLVGFADFINIKKYDDLLEKCNTISDIDDVLNNLCINDNLKVLVLKLKEDAFKDLNDYIKLIINQTFKILNFDSKKTTKFNISIGFNENVIGQKVKEEVINFLMKNPCLEKINVIFKISDRVKEDDINDIISLVTNQKNVTLLFISSEDVYNLEYFSDGVKVYESASLDNNTSIGKLIVSSTSINLARLGLKYKDKKRELFYEELDGLLDLVKNQMLLIFENIGNKLKNNYQILFNGNVYDDEKLDGNQKIRKVIKSCSLNIGVIGLWECASLLESDALKREKLIMQILKAMNQKCKLYTEESKIKFTLFEPSTVSSRKYLMGIDKSIYGVCKNITDKKYYDRLDDHIKDITKFKDYTKLFNGGILYNMALPSNISNKKLMELIKEMQKEKVGLVKLRVGKS